MRKFIPGPFVESISAVMQRVDYRFHCTKDGRPCYHRRINEPRFPRFHAYVTKQAHGLDLDLHIDAQDLIEHKGNHHQPWAYTGPLVTAELDRISSTLLGYDEMHVASGIQRVPPLTPSPKHKESFLQSLLHQLFFH